MFAEKDSLDESVKFLQKNGVRNVVATKGSKGSSVFIGDKRYDIKPCPAKEVIDPTGAGDTFLAAFIVGLNKYSDYEKAGNFASKIATKNIEKKGAL